MRDLMVIGASGTGREILDLVEDLNAISAQWRVCGILDDEADNQGREIHGIPVLGPVDFACGRSEALAIGIASSGNRGARPGIMARLGCDIGRFPTLVHPSASVSRRARIGAGVIVLNNAVIGSEAEIGDFSVIFPNATIGHDSRLGAGVTVGPGAGVSGFVTVGDGAYLGSGCRIRERTQIGGKALVGIGAVVLGDVGPGHVVFGNPARRCL